LYRNAGTFNAVSVVKNKITFIASGKTNERLKILVLCFSQEIVDKYLNVMLDVNKFHMYCCANSIAVKVQCATELEICLLFSKFV